MVKDASRVSLYVIYQLSRRSDISSHTGEALLLAGIRVSAWPTEMISLDIMILLIFLFTLVNVPMRISARKDDNSTPQHYNQVRERERERIE